MVESLKALLADWQETRNITLAFVNELSDADLDKKLPRKVLNTIRLHVHELLLGQMDFVDSLTSKVFKIEEGYQYESLPKQTLIDRMAELDAKLEKSLALMDGTEIIEFFDEPKNVHQFISMMIGHEQMHIGQMIAFCYATGIEIPKSIVEHLNLEG